MNDLPSGKTILCVFAHPDDESFGPGGTIAALSRRNTVFVLCVTDGNDAGRPEQLAAVRREELIRATRILGVESVHFLGYPDGSLSNNSYHRVARDIERFIHDLQPHILLTFEHTGISGHLDHIALSMITSYVFLRSDIPEEVWFYAEPEDLVSRMKDYFIYFPVGIDRKSADLEVDVTEVWETKVRAMHEHQTQKKDIEMILSMHGDLPKREYFFVWDRDSGKKRQP